ncbi:hypothetical protein JXA56_03750 [Candidatus Micrarchaeota archaeon]|nr:hypothetical protein [Candidatus Micrarchaeota archaeon]
MALGEAIIERKAKAGSVGAVWPPIYDSHNNRVKGVCSYILDSQLHAFAMLNQIKNTKAKSNGHTRTTIRAFAAKGLVEDLKGKLGEHGLEIEARFDAGNALKGCEMVYLGGNSCERMPDPVVLRQELQGIDALQSIPPVNYRDAMERVEKNGYAISRLSGSEQKDADDLLYLYNEAYQKYTFEITEDSVKGMLNNGNIVIVGRYGNADIVSALIAEHCQLFINGGKIKVDLFELSDYATRKDHRGNGLITLMQMEAIKTIRRMEKGYEAIIYAEDRAAWTPVNRSSKKAGMKYCGTLPKHCVLESDRDFKEQGEYENLNVWVHTPGNGREQLWNQ